MDDTQLARWRMILGKESAEGFASLGITEPTLSSAQTAIDDALDALYGPPDVPKKGERSAGLGSSSPRLARWLGDVRKYFDSDLVAVIQQDAIERKGLKQLLLEPELLQDAEPNLALLGTLLSLSGHIPEKTKETARMVVRAVVDEIKQTLETPVRQAVLGALNRREHTPIPNARNIDWKWTVGRNLKNFQPALGKLVPERVYFFSRAQKANRWTMIVDLDQSGSMADSVIYGAVMGSILSSLPALKTHVVAFDTEVVDLTESCGSDPVDLLLGVQLGGGTDINKSVAYCETLITDPANTIFFLITDLFEGGNEAQLVRRLAELVASRVRVICLLTLSDHGVPSFDSALAKKLAGLGIPCFGCTPQRLPDLLAAALRGDDLDGFAKGGANA